MATMATPAKEVGDEGKKRFKFNYEEDMELLRLIFKVEPYNAVHGSVAEKWEQIRSALCASLDKQFSARACKDRFSILMQSGFRFKESPTPEMLEESSRLLAAVRQRLDEVKYKGKCKPERGASVDILLPVDALDGSTPSPLNGTTLPVTGVSSKDMATFLRIVDGQLRVSAQQLEDAKEERKVKRQKLEFEQRRFDQEMAFRIQEAERRDRKDAEERAQRHEEFRLLMDLVKGNLLK
ncbi:hypothetical protein ACHHYP_09778 [Achlya hypogyna]|uniref:Myb-like domain-containing protein n=1 Tax=Achlya hypogyna TaxID=1202772 RepID=A0A1V9YMF3_ACHHY|nr:hypothetical protein ACHHYP_09778 [Achlya hypogyna]